MDGRGEDVVRRLPHVDVVVRVHVLAGERGDHLVRVHVRRGARAGLEDVDRELVVELAARDPVAGRGDPLGLLGVEQPELGVDARRGGLDPAEPARRRAPGSARRRPGSSRSPCAVSVAPERSDIRVTLAAALANARWPRGGVIGTARRRYRRYGLLARASSSSQLASFTRGRRAERRGRAPARRSPPSRRSRRTTAPRSLSSSSRSPLAAREQPGIGVGEERSPPSRPRPSCSCR